MIFKKSNKMDWSFREEQWPDYFMPVWPWFPNPHVYHDLKINVPSPFLM